MNFFKAVFRAVLRICLILAWAVSTILAIISLLMLLIGEMHPDEFAQVGLSFFIFTSLAFLFYHLSKKGN